MKKVLVLLFAACSMSAMAMDQRKELIYAAVGGKLTKVKTLLDQGVDINSVNDQGWTPLFAAVHDDDNKKNPEVLKLLLERGADMNIADKGGNTPFSAAVRFGYTKMVELLLDHGADVNIIFKNGKTPLHEAAEMGYTKLAKLLLDRGADMNIEDKNGKTPYMIAEKNRGNSGTIREEGIVVRFVGKNEETYQLMDEWRRLHSKTKGISTPSSSSPSEDGNNKRIMRLQETFIPEDTSTSHQ